MARTNATKPARPLNRPRNPVRIDLGGGDTLPPPGCAYIDRPIVPIILSPELEILDRQRGAVAPRAQPCDVRALE